MSKKEIEKKNIALETLTIDYLPIDEVKPNDYNPNRQSEYDFELLCKSIDEDGMTQPIVALRESRVIVDGEHRWRACKALGFDEVPVVLTDMDPAQARIATLRHNRARGNEDVELAAAVLKDLAKLGIDDYLKDSLMMDEVELDAFLSTVDEPEGFSADEIASLAEADEETLREVIREEGGSVDESESPSVQDAIRAREKKLREAKNDEERSAVARDASVYSLVLVYSKEEKELIKRILGKKPVIRVLEICKERYARGSE